MSSNKFQKLNGLITKLTNAAQKGIKVDNNLKRHQKKSASNLKGMPLVMNRIKNELQITKVTD